MNAPAPADTSPIAQLRARLRRLALDPRVRLLPELPTLARELDGTLERFLESELAISALGDRLAVLERTVATLHRVTFGGPDCE